MSLVKICGIQRKEDVDAVNKYKPDYIGFIFAESRRRVAPSVVDELKIYLAQGIKTVGVFVNEQVETVIDIVERCGLDTIQLHGDEKPGYILDLKKNLVARVSQIPKKIEIWKAIRVQDRASLTGMVDYMADAFVLDTYTDGNYGGTGRVFDWSLAREAKQKGKIILAGGLGMENVKQALIAVQPYGVDVSSGVETHGIKDEGKIKEFIARIRE